MVPATGGTPRQLTNGDWDHNGVEWTPDGKQILFTSLRVPDADYQFRESEIYAVTVETGAIAQLTTRKGPDNGPKVSPDGKLVAYTGIDASRNTWTDSKIYVMNIDGSNPHLVSGNWDRSPQALHVEGGRHRVSTSPRRTPACRIFTCSRWPALAVTRCSR